MTHEITRSNRLIIIMLAIVFAGPIVAAWLLSGQMAPPTADETAARGQLLTPAIPLHNFALKKLDGTSLGLDSLHGKWTLLTVDDPACAEICIDKLRRTRQARLIQGEHLGRIARMLVLDGLPSAAVLAPIIDDHPRLIIGGDAAFTLIPQIEAAIGADSAKGNIFLIDPLGNLMLRYAADVDPRDIYRDMKRLLKASRIG